MKILDKNEIQCEMKKENITYICGFKAKIPGEHRIHIKYGGIPIPESPLLIDIAPPISGPESQVGVSGAGIGIPHSQKDSVLSLPAVPINEKTGFEVLCLDPALKISVGINFPANMEQVSLIKRHKNITEVKYILEFPGID